MNGRSAAGAAGGAAAGGWRVGGPPTGARGGGSGAEGTPNSGSANGADDATGPESGGAAVVSISTNGSGCEIADDPLGGSPRAGGAKDVVSRPSRLKPEIRLSTCADCAGASRWTSAVGVFERFSTGTSLVGASAGSVFAACVDGTAGADRRVGMPRASTTTVGADEASVQSGTSGSTGLATGVGFVEAGRWSAAS